MDEETLTALQGSIAKWEEIVAGTGFDDGADNCPLCFLFVNKEADEPEWAQDGCFGCPVAHAVNEQGCSKTPYSNWSLYQLEDRRFNGPNRVAFDARSKELAQHEVDFLKSLLPSSPSAALDANPTSSLTPDKS